MPLFERARPVGASRSWRGADSAPTVGIVALLAAYNYLSNRVLPAWAYLPANTATAAGLIGLGRAVGLTYEELGLRRHRAGVRAGLVGAGAVALAVATLGALPNTRKLLADERVRGASGLEATYQVLGRIPLGTAVLEEIAFRGVLLGLLLRRGSVGQAVGWSSALFGLWHILPTLDALEPSPSFGALDRAAGKAGSVAIGVIATGAVGGGLGWLRLRTGSIVAPILVHWMANGLGYLMAFLLERAGRFDANLPDMAQ